MGERRRDIIVGFFVVLSAAVALVMVALLGSEQGIFRERFQARAVFGSVSGLRTGAPVFVAGVNVGTVQSIRFVAPREPSVPLTPAEEGREFTRRVGEVEVTMTLEERYRPQIRSDSVATIASVGLLGDKSIEISVGSTDEPEIEPGGVLQSEDPLTLTEVFDQMQPIARKIDSILSDISALTGTMTGREAPVQRAIRSLGSILEKIDEGQGTLGELVNSKILAERAEATLANLESLLDEAQRAAADVERALTDLPPTMASARKVAEEVAALSESLRQSADRLPEITEDIAIVARNLATASGSFPGLAVEAELGVRRAAEVFDAAGQTIFLRGYLAAPPPPLPAALGRADPWLDVAGPGDLGDD